MLFFITLLCSEVFAVPQNLSQQGRLLDSNTHPVEGNHYLTFRIFENLSETTPLWTESLSVNFTNGFYNVILGENISNPLDSNVFVNEPLFLELQIGSETPFVPRQLLNSIPYSIRAGVSESVEGGNVDATQIQVGGTVVIDSNGAWVGPTLTLNWSDIQGIPADFSDGIDNDTHLTEGDVEDFVTNGALDLAAGTTIDGTSLQEAISCQTGQILRWDGLINMWNCDEDSVLTSSDVLGYVTQNPIDLATNSSVGGVSILTEDTDQDALGHLICTNGQVAIYDQTVLGWVCGDSSDTLDSLSCSTGQIPYFENGTWTCQTLSLLFDKDGDGISSWEDCDDNDST